MILYSHSKNFILIALMAASLDLKANRITDDGYFDCPCPLILAHQGAANVLPVTPLKNFNWHLTRVLILLNWIFGEPKIMFGLSYMTESWSALPAPIEMLMN